MADTIPVAPNDTHPCLGGIRLVLGGNVFGWTIDRDRSLAVLDAFYEAGGRMIDTADGYSNWVPGHKGGESETIIGEWLKTRGVRSEMRIATKTGQGGAPGMLAPDTARAALEASLQRLCTDYVDLYYAHRDDTATPLDEVAEAYDQAFTSGRARELGASNYSPARLSAILAVAGERGLHPFTYCNRSTTSSPARSSRAACRTSALNGESRHSRIMASLQASRRASTRRPLRPRARRGCRRKRLAESGLASQDRR